MSYYMKERVRRRVLGAAGKHLEELARYEASSPMRRNSWRSARAVVEDVGATVRDLR